MKLTIGIPTRNRRDYLLALLHSIESHEGTEILVSDNASTDDTAKMLANYRMPRFRYWTNPENIGVGRNVLKLIEQAQGEFIWIMGDDEIMLPGAIPTLLEELRPATGLCIMPPKPGSRMVGAYRNFRGFAKRCETIEPTLLLDHSLITSNVVRKAEFHQGWARKYLEPVSDFSHMHGISGVWTEVIVRDPLYRMRKERAPAVDGVLPDLEGGWRGYLGTLEERGAITSADRVLRAWRRRWLWDVIRDPGAGIRRVLREPKALWWFLRRVVAPRGVEPRSAQ